VPPTTSSTQEAPPEESGGAVLDHNLTTVGSFGCPSGGASHLDRSVWQLVRRHRGPIKLLGAYQLGHAEGGALPLAGEQVPVASQREGYVLVT